MGDNEVNMVYKAMMVNGAKHKVIFRLVADKQQEKLEKVFFFYS